jgi:hypothetical protein
MLLTDISTEVERRGVDRENIGTHSMRKGSATYAASGSTACPSSAAIHLRAGWTLSSVQDTYMRYESAGDMFVGRTVSGLPLDKPEFALLPPQFVARSSEVDKAIDSCFNRIPANLRLVAEFCLASVVYHRNFLLDNLPRQHPVFSCVHMVVCNLGDDTSSASNGLIATGIPPHVSILRDLKVLVEKMDKSMIQQEEGIRKTKVGVINELEQRAMSAGTVTREGLRESLMECLQEAGEIQLVQRVQEPPVEVPREYIGNVDSWEEGLMLFQKTLSYQEVLQLKHGSCGGAGMLDYVIHHYDL